jgi:D-erythro-7,8-dihydroneopterin triphosphate epimerase
MSQAINFSRASNRYQISEALVSITNLRLRTYKGFNPEEKTKQQDRVINAEISYRADTAAVSDDETDAFNYRDITKRMISLIENGRFGLL